MADTYTHNGNPTIDIEDLANQIIRGEWGNGDERRDRLMAAGYNYDVVQDYVNKKLNGTLTDDDYGYAEAGDKFLPKPDNHFERGVGFRRQADYIPNATSENTPKFKAEVPAIRREWSFPKNPTFFDFLRGLFGNLFK